tara:strand:- start:1037 stop:1276 length:240 start_codon:yes stop_codon:yes gene_type:complete
MSPLLHTQPLVFGDSDDENYEIISIIILIILIILYVYYSKKCTHPFAIPVDNIPENCRVFTVDGTEIWNDTEDIERDIR